MITIIINAIPTPQLNHPYLVIRDFGTENQRLVGQVDADFLFWPNLFQLGLEDLLVLGNKIEALKASANA